MKTLLTRKALIEVSSNKLITDMKVNSNDLIGFILRSDLGETTARAIQFIDETIEMNSKNPHLSLTKVQTLKYLKSQPEYFTHREALIVGINMKFHQKKSSAITNNHVKRFFEYASQDESEYKNLSNVGLGIFFFDEAMSCDGKEKKSSLKKSLTCFLECLKNGYATLLVVTKIGLIQGFLGKFKVAIKFLLKGAKLSNNPFLQYSVISKIYTVLKMNNEALFYSRKAQQLALTPNQIMA